MTMCALENYPHVIKNITLFWGSNHCREYLKELLLIEANKNRAGFQPNALFEINFLIDLHDHVFPKFIPKVDDVWFSQEPRVKSTYKYPENLTINYSK